MRAVEGQEALKGRVMSISRVVLVLMTSLWRGLSCQVFRETAEVMYWFQEQWYGHGRSST